MFNNEPSALGLDKLLKPNWQIGESQSTNSKPKSHCRRECVLLVLSKKRPSSTLQWDTATWWETRHADRGSSTVRGTSCAPLATRREQRGCCLTSRGQSF